MKLKLRMTLLSDAVFGSGQTEQGGMDLSVMLDRSGFPYYKASTFKGLFRETLEQYLSWTADDQETEVGNQENLVGQLMGNAGDDEFSGRKLVFSDFCVSDAVKEAVIREIGENKPETITACMTNVRRFTSINPDGTAEKGALRSARCINQGLAFYGEIQCAREDETLVRDVLPMIKWLGSMRSRGFGKVKIEVCGEAG